MTSGDDDRPRLSWREIDQRRAGARDSNEPRPRGRRAEAEAKRATEEYKKQLDSMFTSDPGGAEGEQLAGAMREAHGTPEFAAACAAYRDAAGFPDDPELLALFLDSGEQPLVVGALEAILAGVTGGELTLSKGLRAQVAMLAEDFDASLADVAEEILESV